jgi:putative salt-induced outer membrane protein YdiY
MLKLILSLLGLLFAFSAFADGDKWLHESELGINIATGNSSTQTYQIKQKTDYIFDANLLRLSGHYLYGKSRGLEAAKNWDSALRYERSLSEAFGVYVGNGWEGDIFVGYDYRTNVDIGGKYYFILGDKKVDYFFSELGYRYSYEHHIPGVALESLTANIVRGYFEGVKSFADNFSGKLWLELLPDLSNGDNFQMNFEGSVAMALSTNLSFKVAYLGKYRNLPLVTGNEKYDSFITAALLAKF